MIHLHTSGRVYEGTLAEFNADPGKFKKGDILMPTDSQEVRIADGIHAFPNLISLKAQAQVAHIAPLATADVNTLMTAMQTAGLMKTS